MQQLNPWQYSEDKKLCVCLCKCVSFLVKERARHWFSTLHLTRVPVPRAHDKSCFLSQLLYGIVVVQKVMGVYMGWGGGVVYKYRVNKMNSFVCSDPL